MIEALALFAALSTADAVGRASPEFALCGELGRFPPAEVCLERRNLAYEHAAWLRCRLHMDADICPSLPDLILRQELVVEAYESLATARDWVAAEESAGVWAVCPDWPERSEAAARLRELLGDLDYFFGRLPGPVPGWGR